ncbi:MAG: TIGR01777 family protein [bacterium]|jgi:hypothetical protein
MKVAISGAGGFIGSALCDRFRGRGWDISRLTRVRPAADDASQIYWNHETGEIEAAKLEGIDAVVHLAGKSLASGKWTPKSKEEFRRSRIDGTLLVAKTLAGLADKPKVLVCASATGYYGPGNPLTSHQFLGEPLDESAPAGFGYLAELCRDWEAAAEPARAAGIRVVNVRIGFVISPRGGTLRQMLLPFRLGLGGNFASGKQVMNLISLTDLVSIFAFAIENDFMEGAINGVCPAPLTNAQFTRAMSRVIRRPAFCHVPAFVLKAIAGELAEFIIAGEPPVVSSRLAAARFKFLCPDAEKILEFEISGRIP